MNPRATAVSLLGAWLRTGAFPDRALERLPDHHAFVMEVVLGTLRSLRALRWMERQLVEKKPRAALEAFLLVGLYQLLFMTHVEPYAAVHETIEAAKDRLSPGECGFLNAVLRRAQKQKESLLAALEAQPPGVRFSHPDLLLERWSARYGAEAAGRLCAWNNQPAETVVTVAVHRVARDRAIETWRAAGIEATPHPAAPERSLVLPRGVRVIDLPGFCEGWFYVQDPAAHAAVELLAPAPGQRILDACAAPGGKTFLLADMLRGRAGIIAADLHPDRLRRLRENTARMNWPCIEIIRHDARTPPPGGPFDRILLDVPCTNTGVIRRRPDARWRFSLERLRDLTSTQSAMLSAAVTALRPGGRLVYSTCSLEPGENEELVQHWLQRNPAFRLVEERRRFPPADHTDGAYAALIEKPGPDPNDNAETT